MVWHNYNYLKYKKKGQKWSLQSNWWISEVDQHKLLSGGLYYLAKSQVCYLARLWVCLSVCLFVCLFTLYRPQFLSNCFQIFFLDRYPPGIDQVPTWCESGNGIRSKKIPENPKNPYLSSLQKFQKFKSQPKIIRIDSHSLETFIGLISTPQKILTPKSQSSRSWWAQTSMPSNVKIVYNVFIFWSFLTCSNKSAAETFCQFHNFSTTHLIIANI